MRLGIAGANWRRLPLFLMPGWRLFCRVALVVALVILAHKLDWIWLRLTTSESLLRIWSFSGVAADRASSDTIRLQGQLFQFGTSCTFVDVFLGAIPLAWDLKKSTLKNLGILIASGLLLMGFNISRLALGIALFLHGVPQVFSDNVLGGVAYFLVWLLLVSLFSKNWWNQPASQTGQGEDTRSA